MPAFGYDINHKPSPVGSSGPGSAFREQSMFSNAGASPPVGGHGATPTLQQPRLASPANFSPAPHFAGRGSPPSPNFGTANMFDSPDAHNSGAVEFKPTVTSPGEYPSVSRGGMMGMGMATSLFESPRTSGVNAGSLASLAQASLQSPGYGGSQQSVGGLGINDVFADLIDHDAVGLDGSNDVKDKEETGARPSTEPNGHYAAVAHVDPGLVSKADDYDASLLDAPFVSTTEGASGVQEQSSAPGTEDAADPTKTAMND
jgi:hypothetical protein